MRAQTPRERMPMPMRPTLTIARTTALTTVLTFASLPALAETVAPESLAKGAEITAAIAGNTVEGSMSATGVYTEFYAADGTIKGPDYTGKWTIKDDAMCFAYEGLEGDCWQVQIAGDKVTWVKDGTAGGTGTIVPGNAQNF